MGGSINDMESFDEIYNNSTPEIKAAWDDLKKTPNSPKKWVDLLQKTDPAANASSPDPDNTMKVYEHSQRQFLERFPFCVVYWQKLAKTLTEYSGPTQAIKVYQDALKHNNSSYELWIDYCSLVDQADSADVVRETYLQAVKASGRDLRASKLWDEWLNWARKQPDSAKYQMEIYTLIFSYPLADLDRYFKDYDVFARQNPLLSIVSEEQRLQYGTTDEGQLYQQLQEDFRKRKEISEQEAKERLEYEQAIKKFHFGFSPLPSVHLQKWMEYIMYDIGLYRQRKHQLFSSVPVEVDMESDEDTPSNPHKHIAPHIAELLRTLIFQFHKCLVRCANYSRFWAIYLGFLWTEREDLKSFDSSADKKMKIETTIVPQLACTVDPNSLSESLTQIMMDTLSFAQHIIFSDRTHGHFNQTAALLYEAEGLLKEAEDAFRSTDAEDNSENTIRYSYFLLRRGRKAEADEIMQKHYDQNKVNDAIDAVLSNGMLAAKFFRLESNNQKLADQVFQETDETLRRRDPSGTAIFAYANFVSNLSSPGPFDPTIPHLFDRAYQTFILAIMHPTQTNARCLSLYQSFIRRFVFNPHPDAPLYAWMISAYFYVNHSINVPILPPPQPTSAPQVTAQQTVAAQPPPPAQMQQVAMPPMMQQFDPVMQMQMMQMYQMYGFPQMQGQGMVPGGTTGQQMMPGMPQMGYPMQ
ncbi:putative Pre-mRNA-processing factor 39 [Blattamonas nauphoetae]|uniref:Pre-mRNA-processing factor 39 n=1 Tax=Blattamonas nauphoetae TaxID=2049346 RepID=A0ABQ9YHH1_9EUKA|nr:putative Pre-mRNA-processing factor 39 [Blattamonas nauphoetae]